MARSFNQVRAHLALNIREQRALRRLSQEQLALQADVDRTYVSQIERELGNPSLLVLGKLSAVLKVDVAELLVAR